MKQYFVYFYLTLLKLLAQAHLAKNKPLIIGITGSAGKSSTTKLVGKVLSQEFNTKYTKKGNSETGIPLEILNIPIKNYSMTEWFTNILKGIHTVLFNWEKYSIFVAEMGIDSDQAPKNMSTLLDIIRPEVGVLLNVNNVHLENYHGKKVTQTIADEKGKLLFSLPKNGLAILSSDQKELQNLLKAGKIKSQVATFSIKNKANVTLNKHTVNEKASHFEFSFKDNTYSITLKKMVVFKEAFEGIAATLLILDFLGIEATQACTLIEREYEILPGRGILFDGINDSLIIDSSYNSSLAPTSAALTLLKKLKKKNSRTIAVLGDMRELGDKAQHDHEELEKSALKNADVIYTVGPLTNKYFKSKKIIRSINAYSALDKLKKEIQKNDIILIKGSQNTILLESIVAGLLKNKKDIVKLCRQSPYWEKKREELKAIATA